MVQGLPSIRMIASANVVFGPFSISMMMSTCFTLQSIEKAGQQIVIVAGELSFELVAEVVEVMSLFYPKRVLLFADYPVPA